MLAHSAALTQLLPLVSILYPPQQTLSLSGSSVFFVENPQSKLTDMEKGNCPSQFTLEFSKASFL